MKHLPFILRNKLKRHLLLIVDVCHVVGSELVPDSPSVCCKVSEEKMSLERYFARLLAVSCVNRQPDCFRLVDINDAVRTVLFQ